MFIVFEGGDGAGKTTQARLLADHFQSREQECRLYRDPGHTLAGERIRHIALDASLDMQKETVLLLYTAARCELAALIASDLAAGRTVICDRWVMSTIAYQGYGQALSIPLIKRLAAEFTSGISPDLTFILDLPAREAKARCQAAAATKTGDPKDDRFEGRDERFFELMRQAYSYQYDAYSVSGKVHIVDAMKSVEVVHETIKLIVAGKLPQERNVPA